MIKLTPSEKAVLEFTAQGLTNKEIAEEMCRTTRTIEFHLNNIYRKIGTSVRIKMVLIAKEKGLV